MASSKRFPPCNKEQVLCKRAQLKAIQEQQKRWMEQRAAHLRCEVNPNADEGFVAGEDAELAEISDYLEAVGLQLEDESF